MNITEQDVIREDKIRSCLAEDADLFDLEIFPEITSTNTYLKEKAALAQRSGDPDSLRTWHTVIASAQTAGRGRLGRTFASPAGTGLYMSVLLRPETEAGTAARITTAAAVAACTAIESCTEEHPRIKWVNDVFVRGKKACGILTEASVRPETGRLDWAVMGIGFNVYEPSGGFPAELREIAGAIAEEKRPDLRSRIAAAFLRAFYRLCSDLENADYAEEYKRRCFLIGREINVISRDSVAAAKALDLDSECRLIVRYADGSTAALSSGEVSVRAVP